MGLWCSLEEKKISGQLSHKAGGLVTPVQIRVAPYSVKLQLGKLIPDSKPSFKASANPVDTLRIEFST